MKAKHHQKDDQRKSECNQSDDNIRKVIERSFFEWSDGMRVIRQGKGEVAMTEGELARFFNVSWQKINHKVRLIKQTMCLKHYEIKAANAISSVSKQGITWRVMHHSAPCPFGLSKTHAQHIMESIAYNLYRTPGIIVSNSIR